MKLRTKLYSVHVKRHRSSRSLLVRGIERFFRPPCPVCGYPSLTVDRASRSWIHAWYNCLGTDHYKSFEDLEQSVRQRNCAGCSLLRDAWLDAAAKSSNALTISHRLSFCKTPEPGFQLLLQGDQTEGIGLLDIFTLPGTYLEGLKASCALNALCRSFP